MATPQMQKAHRPKEKYSGGIMLISVHPVTNKKKKKDGAGYLPDSFSSPPDPQSKPRPGWTRCVFKVSDGGRRSKIIPTSAAFWSFSFQCRQSTWYQSNTWFSRKHLYHRCPTLCCRPHLDHSVIFGLHGHWLDQTMTEVLYFFYLFQGMYLNYCMFIERCKK